MNLALHHLLAACRFAARTYELEQENSGQPFGGFWEEILHNSLAVATLTVASLESYANEMYFEGSILGDSLSPAAAAEISTLIDRESVLKKYSLALAIRAEKRLDFGSSAVQNADALIKLRNSVVHFRPEWFGEQQSHEKLSRRLQHRFQPSPFLPNELLFPRSWASASFAYWAVQSSVAFIKNFYAEIGLPCPLDQFDEKIALLLNPA
ncbi:hypothetical protein A1D30_01345 [Acidovorax sp. GW101-3H11]|uniref:hypothetical protein n=1 Tax=Acidovorax sp. GW101-3H11 TaxID=1813946 RepID=UPI0007B5256D|nr:hypothetical protein [Acidovorax sp. GW101-3H11]KZT17729.1 hypothetical protein A1D30_01345 [Acidovorax sp. GW101-3H11]